MEETREPEEVEVEVVDEEELPDFALMVDVPK